MMMTTAGPNNGRAAGDSRPGVGLHVRNLWKVFPRPRQRVTPDDLASPERVAALEKAGAVVAVRGVSFDIRPGELFVVMGLSGSGKSTLIRCLLRLVEPTAGSIVVGGEDITRYDEKALIEFRRHRAAMVFQHYGLLPHRTVLDNVAFGLKLRGMPVRERQERAREMLARVGLEGWDDRYPGELSGGMRQRVGIARALANDPDIMLWDEPFSGLDPLIRREMQEELARLQSEMQKTILFVTHDLDEALRLADRIAVMKDGSFVQVASPEELLQAPANDYVRRFVQGRAPVNGRAESGRAADSRAANGHAAGDRARETERTAVGAVR